MSLSQWLSFAFLIPRPFRSFRIVSLAPVTHHYFPALPESERRRTLPQLAQFSPVVIATYFLLCVCLEKCLVVPSRK